MPHAVLDDVYRTPCALPLVIRGHRLGDEPLGVVGRRGSTSASLVLGLSPGHAALVRAGSDESFSAVPSVAVAWPWGCGSSTPRSDGIRRDRSKAGHAEAEFVRSYESMGFEHVMVRHVTGDHTAMMRSFELLGEVVSAVSPGGA